MAEDDAHPGQPDKSTSGDGEHHGEPAEGRGSWENPSACPVIAISGRKEGAMVRLDF